jgi:putative transposase
MARTIYSEINLHITWHTNNSAPVITDPIDTQLYRWLRGRILQAPGVLLLAIGGTDDHVHLAVTVPPTLLVSEWIGELKGASAHYLNHTLANRKVIEWQSGYGVVSFGTKAMPWVVRYVENQREHHAKRTTYERLERVEIEKRKPVETGSLEMSGHRRTGRKRPA